MYKLIASQINEVTRDEALDHLAKSIVIQAIEDYRRVLNGIKINRYKHIKNDQTEIERFFKSDWCYALSNWDGEALITLIKKQEGIEE